MSSTLCATVTPLGSDQVMVAYFLGNMEADCLDSLGFTTGPDDMEAISECLAMWFVALKAEGKEIDPQVVVFRLEDVAPIDAPQPPQPGYIEG